MKTTIVTIPVHSDAATGGSAPPANAPAMILDSNVWVDMLVFDDPRVQPIRAALEAGRMRVVISPSCREELRRVLDYPQFARFAIDNQAALAWVDSRTTLIESAPHDVVASDGASRLPRCKDRDDQKFLELARDAGAAWLISKDKAVLKLRKRMRHETGCEIGLPQALVAWLERDAQDGRGALDTRSIATTDSAGASHASP